MAKLDVAVAVVGPIADVDLLPRFCEALTRDRLALGVHLFGPSPGKQAYSGRPRITVHTPPRELSSSAVWLRAANWLLTFTEAPFLFLCGGDLVPFPEVARGLATRARRLTSNECLRFSHKSGKSEGNSSSETDRIQKDFAACGFPRALLEEFLTVVDWRSSDGIESQLSAFLKSRQAKVLTLSQESLDGLSEPTDAAGSPDKPTTREDRSLPREPPRRLAVIGSYFNPCGYQSVRVNYQRWLGDLRACGLPVFVAEVAFPGQEFVDPDTFLQLRAGPEHMLWQKERLLNLIVEKLPDEYDAVAWIDTDAILLNRKWPTEAMAALSEYAAVQPWDQWHYTNLEGRVDLTVCSIGPLGERLIRPGKIMAAPGGAWVARRDVFPLYDRHALGGGDSALVEAWLDRPNCFVVRKFSAACIGHFAKWQAEAWQKIQGRVTSLPGDVIHLYHGDVVNRRYVARHQILVRHGFDPARHVQVDEQGLLAWTEEAPITLRQEVRDYFFSRLEDAGLPGLTTELAHTKTETKIGSKTLMRPSTLENGLFAPASEPPPVAQPKSDTASHPPNPVIEGSGANGTSALSVQPSLLIRSEKPKGQADKILMTGVCYVHRLLQLRFTQDSHSFIRDVHPSFDVNKVRFFHEDISKQFLFTDFHGKYSSLETKATDLRELLRLYNDHCRVMYVIGATHIADVDMATVLTPADYWKLSVFWYFLFDTKWNPTRAKQWGDDRDKVLLALLKEFPKLRFIFYQPSCVRWWQQMGLPKDRMLFWSIDWGMTEAQFEEIRQKFLAENRKGAAHRFPTEESYNELCDMILKDYNRMPTDVMASRFIA